MFCLCLYPSLSTCHFHFLIWFSNSSSSCLSFFTLNSFLLFLFSVQKVFLCNLRSVIFLLFFDLTSPFLLSSFLSKKSPLSTLLSPWGFSPSSVSQQLSPSPLNLLFPFPFTSSFYVVTFYFSAFPSKSKWKCFRSPLSPSSALLSFLPLPPVPLGEYHVWQIGFRLQNLVPAQPTYITNTAALCPDWCICENKHRVLK